MNSWLPFNAVCDGTSLVDKIEKEKSRFRKPTLSEEQLIDIQDKILTAYNNKDTINIKYYNAGYCYEIKNIIKKIDEIERKIILKNGKVIFFSQIMNVNS